MSLTLLPSLSWYSVSFISYFSQSILQHELIFYSVVLLDGNMQWDLLTGSTKLKQQLNEWAGTCVNSEVVFVVYPISYKFLSAHKLYARKAHLCGSPLYNAAITSASSTCNTGTLKPHLSLSIFNGIFLKKTASVLLKKEPWSYGQNGLLFFPKMIFIWLTSFHFTRLWKFWLWIGGHFSYWTGILSRNIIEL